MPSGLARALTALTGAQVADLTPAGGHHGMRHYRAALADGRLAFVKAAAGAPGTPGGAQTGPGGADAAMLAAEAAGLRWLAGPGVVGVPEVLGCADGLLVTGWIAPGQASRPAAERFGRELARLHAAGPGRLGAPWPGYIASLPLPNDDGDDWAAWHAGQRILPFARRARDAGQLSAADVTLIETVAARLPDLAGPPEPPSRIHGDCWAGNVLWSGGAGWLIDPAAHGGHRETDLAMLDLFGAPWLETILAAYDDTAPLAGGWRARIPLHQLHPLLVHVCLFGAGYRDQALAAARAALAA